MPAADTPGWAVRRVQPVDVGERVTLRRRLPDDGPDAGHFSDVVGELLSWEAGVLTVRRRDGEVVAVADAEVVASRVVPPAPTPRRPR